MVYLCRMKTKENILVSACLLGKPVRFDGKSKPHPDINKLKHCNLIPICPEMFGGLPTPRPPHELKNGKAITVDGTDITAQSTAGANKCLEIAKTHGAKLAILKAKSPSCGVGKIYDGTFSGTLVDGNGLTTQLLQDNGIQVITENDIHTVLP